jgi:hypothetical protein
VGRITRQTPDKATLKGRAGRQADRQADRQAGRQAEAGRQAGRQVHHVKGYA